MNAHALLTSQGWRGTGHSLHPTSDTTGLSKPLLVSQKRNNLGVGKKQHKTSDMWWMNAFDSSLKGLDTSKEGVVVQTQTSGGLDMVAKGGGKYVGKGGLYASFVRGEGLHGTLTEEEKAAEKEAGRKLAEHGAKGTKRKRDEGEESKEERRARKAAKRAGRDQVSDDGVVKFPGSVVILDTSGSIEETKEERKARKAEKRMKNEKERKDFEIIDTPDDSARGETKEERRARKAARRLVKEDKDSKATNTPDDSAREETKEERRAKKGAKSSSRAKKSPVKEKDEGFAKTPETKEERKERKRLKKLAQEGEDASTEICAESKKKRKRKD